MRTITLLCFLPFLSIGQNVKFCTNSIIEIERDQTTCITKDSSQCNEWQFDYQNFELMFNGTIIQKTKVAYDKYRGIYDYEIAPNQKFKLNIHSGCVDFIDSTRCVTQTFYVNEKYNCCGEL